MGNNITSILFSPPSFWVCCQQPATLWTRGKPLVLVTMPDRCSRPRWAGACGKSRLCSAESPYNGLVRLVRTAHWLRAWLTPQIILILSITMGHLFSTKNLCERKCRINCAGWVSHPDDSAMKSWAHGIWLMTLKTPLSQHHGNNDNNKKPSKSVWSILQPKASCLT